MATSKAMTELYEAKRDITQTYVHATSRGHEAIQLACSLQLKAVDYLYPYYRDDAMLLGIGMQPYDLMLQLLAKTIRFQGRTYYSHPSLRDDDDKPKNPAPVLRDGHAKFSRRCCARHSVPARKWTSPKAGATKNPSWFAPSGTRPYRRGNFGSPPNGRLKQFPLLMLVQDNGWDISATLAETRSAVHGRLRQGLQRPESRSSGRQRLQRLLPRHARSAEKHAHQAPALPRARQSAPAEPPHVGRSHGMSTRRPGRAR